jgi:hypothetical protein
MENLDNVDKIPILKWKEPTLQNFGQVFVLELKVFYKSSNLFSNLHWARVLG